MRTMAAVVGMVMVTTVGAFACGDHGLPDHARRAISENESVAREAREALRSMGPRGLEALFVQHADILPPKATGPARLRLCAALDFVGKQKDCWASRLYWYTDFEKAKAAAKAGGKPILSLRLLGNLDDELSCANSRFFRTVLYANEEVSKTLRERFVLHWKSVRPVPKVTIDFGDGRVLERTVTGNSIHYVLDVEGRPIDALPGLYGPRAFLRGLANAEDIAHRVAALKSAEREASLRTYHAGRLNAIVQQWTDDLERAKAVNASAERAQVRNVNARPTATEASRIAASKREEERPILNSLTTIDPGVDDGSWARIAQLHAGDARLDAASRELVRSKNPDAFAASRLAMTKALVEDPLLRAVRGFERSIAEDTIRNEYQLHRRIHQWFANGPFPTNVDALNERVYAELFLTPSSDPWLGLASNDAYSALWNDGKRIAAGGLR